MTSTAPHSETVNALPGDDDDDGTDIYPLGEDPRGTRDDATHPPGAPSFQSTTASELKALDSARATEPCPVCRGLVPSMPIPGTASVMDLRELALQLGLGPPADHVRIEPIFMSSERYLYHDMISVKDYSPPWPQATTWIKSAMTGCKGCQLVVEGASSFVPFWFDDLCSTPGALQKDLFKNKIIMALSFFGNDPLHIWLLDTSKVQYHRRVICLELFTKPGISPTPETQESSPVLR